MHILEYVFYVMQFKYKPKTLWIEFGKESGETINYISKFTKELVIGFDCFHNDLLNIVTDFLLTEHKKISFIHFFHCHMSNDLFLQIFNNIYEYLDTKCMIILHEELILTLQQFLKNHTYITMDYIHKDVEKNMCVIKLWK